MDQSFMQRAIELSRLALEEPGTEPFGAVVVEDGRIVGEGLNRSAARLEGSPEGGDQPHDRGAGDVGRGRADFTRLLETAAARRRSKAA